MSGIPTARLLNSREKTAKLRKRKATTSYSKWWIFLPFRRRKKSRITKPSIVAKECSLAAVVLFTHRFCSLRLSWIASDRIILLPPWKTGIEKCYKQNPNSGYWEKTSVWVIFTFHNKSNMSRGQTMSSWKVEGGPLKKPWSAFQFNEDKRKKEPSGWFQFHLVPEKLVSE